MVRFAKFPGAAIAVLLLAAAGIAPVSGPMPAAAAEAAFVEGIDDLPLMPGLAPIAEEGVVFDKPGGRIIHAVARGTVSADAVQRFYAETAPQLGWRRAGDSRFERDGEVLQIEFTGSPGRTGAGPLTVRFILLPQ